MIYLIFAIQPLGQTVDETSNVTFYAAAYGAPPIVFQWYFNNTPVGPPTFNTNLTVLSLPKYSIFTIWKLQCSGIQWLWWFEEFQRGANCGGGSTQHNHATDQPESFARFHR